MQITVNEPGARTIADSRPMQINGQNVYVLVSDNEAALMVGGQVVAVNSPQGMNNKGAQDWAVSYRESLAAYSEGVVDQDAVEEAVNIEAVYAEAVESVRDAGAMLDRQADRMAATATDAPHRYRNSSGRVCTVDSQDHRHPLNASASLKQRAAVLMGWTAQDEYGYKRYVSDGIGDTDGHYAPLTRDAWKGTLGRTVGTPDPWAAVTITA